MFALVCLTRLCVHACLLLLSSTAVLVEMHQDIAKTVYSTAWHCSSMHTAWLKHARHVSGPSGRTINIKTKAGHVHLLLVHLQPFSFSAHHRLSSDTYICIHAHATANAGFVLHSGHQESYAVHHAGSCQGVQPVMRNVAAVQDAVHRPRQCLPSQQPFQVHLLFCRT